MEKSKVIEMLKEVKQKTREMMMMGFDTSIAIDRACYYLEELEDEERNKKND